MTETSLKQRSQKVSKMCAFFQKCGPTPKKSEPSFFLYKWLLLQAISKYFGQGPRFGPRLKFVSKLNSNLRLRQRLKLAVYQLFGYSRGGIIILLTLTFIISSNFSIQYAKFLRHVNDDVFEDCGDSRYDGSIDSASTVVSHFSSSITVPRNYRKRMGACCRRVHVSIKQTPSENLDEIFGKADWKNEIWNG